MMRIDTGKLNEEAFVTCMDNGLTVYFVNKPGFKKKAALLGINYGSVDTAFESDGAAFQTPAGTAHFLEHKLFDMPDGRNALQLFSRMGASPNAFTSGSATAYHFECTGCFDDAFKLLLECVFTPFFTESGVEKERGIIAREISMYADMPAARLYNGLMPMLYAEHPIRGPVIGTAESIAEISDKTLYDCYNAFYRPSNMVLAVAGDLDSGAVEEAVARLSPRNGAPPPRFAFSEPPEIPEYEKTMYWDVPQPMFLIGVKLPPQKMSLQREIQCKLALDALCGTSSKLYGELYDMGLIDSSFGASPYFFKGGGVLLFTGLSPDPPAVRNALLREAERLAAAGIEPALFERVKRAEWGERIRELDSPMSIVRGAALGRMSGADFFSLPEAFDGLDAEMTGDIFSQMGNMAIIQCRRNGNDS